MFIDPLHLEMRHIFRVEAQISRTAIWRSPTTGRVTHLVGFDGFADSEHVTNALWSLEGVTSREPPALAGLRAEYPQRKQDMSPRPWLIARRVLADGSCRADADLLCLDPHATEDDMFGILTVDLVGYGPKPSREEYHTSACGAPSPWPSWKAVALWERPHRMIKPALLRYGDVVRSEQFARAFTHAGDDQGDLFLRADWPAARYAALAEALFVVEGRDFLEHAVSCSGRMTEGLGLYRYSLRRLDESGRYRPYAQRLEFEQLAWERREPDRMWSDPFQPMELVGRLPFDGRPFLPRADG